MTELTPELRAIGFDLTRALERRLEQRQRVHRRVRLAAAVVTAFGAFGLARYQAFVLHEQTVAAAGGGGEHGALCSAEELTRAETTALETLRSSFAAGTGAGATRSTVEAALEKEFAGTGCRGLDYAGERARFVFAGIEPGSMLMPGVR